jgi:hypothetical protein
MKARDLSYTAATYGDRIAEIRYAFPAELDLMARLAGLELKHRWAGWQKEPFSAAAPKHVSVYVKRET